MATSTHFKLGYIKKPYSFKGGVVALFDVEDPSAYDDLERVFLEVKGDLVPFFITQLQVRGKGEVRMELEDIESDKEARSLVGCSIFLPKAELKHVEQADHEWIGFKVVDKTEGPLGEVAEFIDHPGNPLLRCILGFEDYFIPLNAGFVKSADGDQRTLFVNFPEGLIDLPA